MAAMHVFDAWDKNDVPDAHVYVVAGNDAFLRRLAVELIQQTASVDVDRIDGDSAGWRDVIDQVSTRSLFGGPGEQRLVLVDPAGEFVSQHRERLEKHVASTASVGRLILSVDTFPATTRLYKAVEKHGLRIECGPPKKASGKAIDVGRSRLWIQAWAERQHQVTLASDGLDRLWDLIGPVYGQLDQELAKLALYAQPDQAVNGQLVSDVVGGWKTRTTWELIDAAAAGNVADALAQLDQLLFSGEVPIALFGQISWSLKRYAAAARLYDLAEKSGQRIRLDDAIRRAGFRWQGEVDQARKNLVRMGRPRALRIYQWLVDLDLALKGTHSSAVRSRLALEQFIVRVARPRR